MKLNVVHRPFFRGTGASVSLADSYVPVPRSALRNSSIVVVLSVVLLLLLGAASLALLALLPKLLLYLEKRLPLLRPLLGEGLLLLGGLRLALRLLGLLRGLGLAPFLLGLVELLLLFAAIALLLSIFGQSIGESIGASFPAFGEFLGILYSFRSLIGYFGLIFVFLFIYKFLPNCHYTLKSQFHKGNI